jgi:hypothetical protein
MALMHFLHDNKAAILSAASIIVYVSAAPDAGGPVGGRRANFQEPYLMNTPSALPASGRRSADDDVESRADLAHDVVYALEPVDEAIDVAFLAVKAAQQAIRSVPDGLPTAKLLDEWRTHNILVRQSLRLVDERVQELTKAVKRLPRVG